MTFVILVRRKEVLTQMSTDLHWQQDRERLFTKDFALIWFANFLIFLGFQMTLPTIPIFVSELGGSDQIIGVIVGVFTFSALLIRPYVGHALETKGRGAIYLFGLALFVVSVGTFGFITSITLLILMRIIQGIGWGFSSTASGTIATDLIPAHRRGEGMGYYGLSGNLALAIGPALGLTLADVISFTQLFLITALLGLFAFILSLFISYKKVEKAPERTRVTRFDVVEKSALHPAIILMFVTLTFGGITTFLPLYAMERDVSGIQLYFVTYALFVMLSRVFAGRVYDRRGDVYVVPPGITLIIIAMLLLAWLPNTFVLVLGGALYGLGFGTIQPALQAWAVNAAPANRKGMANATFFSAFDFGIGIGALLFGQVAYLLNYTFIYIISACSVFIALLYYLFLLVTGRRSSYRQAN